MARIVRPALAVAAIALATFYLLPDAVLAGFTIRFPLFHHTEHDWTQFRGPDNNAVVPGKLETAWRVETGGQISASPTVADNVLYLGNNDGRLYAIDPTNGHAFWTFATQNPLMSAPLVYGDLVIVGEGDANSMGSSPPEPIKVGQGPSSLIALDRRSGKVRWKRAIGGSGMPTPAIINGVLVQHNGGGWVGGYDPATGDRKFAHHLESVASMSAILPLGGDQFVTSGVGTNAVWKMSATDGSILWSSTFPHGASGIGDCPPATDGARIYCDYVMPVPPDTGTQVGRPAVERIFAIDVATGAKVWDVAAERGTLAPRNEAAIPLLTGGVVVVGSALAPVMHGFDAASGRALWTLKTRGPVKGGSVAVDGTVYFGDFGGYLWAIDARTGQVVGDKSMNTRFNVGSPIVDGKTLIDGSDTGAILAIPLETIRQSHDT
ncbi:MAG: PQQ-binding-like beta-propeller repeat protein [Candidatus Eremiobacteraeota bacterium]|nr:PQQ-binding-like beta-propeller repeat protein [Candidatus Eremiobacteraeota bacterium]